MRKRNMEKLTAAVLLLSLALTGCAGINGNKASSSGSGEISVQKETGTDRGKKESNIAAQTETAPSEETKKSTERAEIRADGKNSSVLTNRAAVINGDMLYLLAENKLSGIRIGDIGNDKAGSNVIYEAKEGQSIISYAVSGDFVYFILQQKDGKTSLWQAGTDGKQAKDLKDFDDGTFMTIQAAGGNLYLYSNGDSVSRIIFSVDSNGTLSEKMQDSDPYYKNMLDKKLVPSDKNDMEINASTTGGSAYYSVPYCMETFGRMVFLDTDHNLVISDPSGKTDAEQIKVIKGADSSETGYSTPAALTEKYLILEEGGSSNGDFSWKSVNLSSGEKKTFYTGKAEDEILDFDKEGMIVGRGTNNGSKANSSYSVTKISYEDGKETNLFSFTPEDSINITYGTFVSQSFTETAAGYLYVRTKDYDDFWFLRTFDHPETEIQVGSSVFESGFRAAGLTVNGTDENIYPDNDQTKTAIINVKVQTPVFSGSSDAVKNMNKIMSDDTKKTADAAVSAAKEDYAQNPPAGEENAGFPYLHQQNVTGITYNDERYICIRTYAYDFTGGAHGNGGSSYYTFDRTTGVKLKLSDIVSDSDEEVRSLMLKYLKKEIAENPDQFFEDAEGEAKKLKVSDYNFFLDKNGLGIEFGNYELAPYAAGSQVVTIPYSDLKLKIQLTQK